MFSADKPLPPPPLPEKPSWKSKENTGETSTSATTAARPRPSSAAGMHNLSSTNYSPTIADYVYRRVLRQATAAICKQAGFEVIESEVLELLTHMVNSYINELAVSTRQMTEHAGRTISTPSDTIMALVDLGTAVSEFPAYLKETTSKGSLVIAPPRVQHVVHGQQQLRVGNSRPRPSHIPDWLPPFPDPHTYVHTDISGEPEPSYEKAREGLASLHRNNVISLKDFVLSTHPSISLFDAHKQRILKVIATAAAERNRQRQAEMMASVEENEQTKTMTNGEASVAAAAAAATVGTLTPDSEQLGKAEPEFNLNDPEKSRFFEDDSIAEIGLLHSEIPTFGEIVEPKATAEPYLDALLFDVQSEPSVSGTNVTSASGATGASALEESGTDGNPFLLPPKMPSVMDDDEEEVEEEEEEEEDDEDDGDNDSGM